MPLTRVIELALEEEYTRAVTYAVHYESGWDTAQTAFARLQAYKQGLVEMAQGAATEEDYRLAA
ncbi:MAG: hypothetical protein V1724_01205 [Chloroflexota bacterium]